MRPSMAPGATRILPQIASCPRSLRPFDPNTTMSSAGVVDLACRLAQMFAPPLIRSKAVASNDGRLAMRQRRHRQAHVSWLTLRIDMHLTDPATTRTIRCPHTLQVRTTIMDKRLKLCSTSRASPCTPTLQPFSHLRTNNTIWKYLALCLRKVSFACCKAMRIVTKAVHRTLQIFRTHQICILRCMKILWTHLSLT